MGNDNSPGHVSKRAVAYVRVSSVAGRGADEFHSPELQRRAIRDYAKRNDLIEVATYEDIDRSGRDFAREGVQQAFADARAGKYDVLALYDLSRFGRNTADSLQNIRALKESGVAVVSTREQFDDSPEGQFQLTQFLAMNQLRSEQIGRQWQETHRYRLEGGKWHGIPPLGYVRGGGNIVPAPPVSDAVAKAFHDYATGRGVRTIARDLSEAANKDVAPITVRRMLRNVAYIGMVRFYETETKRRKSGQTYRARIPGTEQTLPGEHEPLIDRELFERVQARIQAEATEPPRRKAEPVDALTGVVVCGACGARMVLHKVRGRQAGGRVFECPKRNAKACEGVGAPASHVVLTSVLEYVSVWALGEGERTPKAAAQDARRRARALETARGEVADLEASLQRLTALLVSGDITDTAYKVTAEKYDADLTKARRELAGLEGEYAPPVEGDPVGELLGTLDPSDPATFLERARRIAALVDSGEFYEHTTGEQNRLLKGLIRRVVIGRNPEPGKRGRMDDRLTIDWL